MMGQLATDFGICGQIGRNPLDIQGIWPQIEKQGSREIPAQKGLHEARALFHGKEGVDGSSPSEGSFGTPLVAGDAALVSVPRSGAAA